MYDDIRPSYIPVSFFKHVASVFISELKTLAKMNDQTSIGADLQRKTSTDAVRYLYNLISDDLILKDFYDKNGHDQQLLTGILQLFIDVAYWKYSYKTTSKQDYEVSLKLRKHIISCIDLLYESPDIRFNLQDQLDYAIKKTIRNSCENHITEKGKETLKVAENLVFPHHLVWQDLIDQGFIKEEHSMSTRLNHDLLGILSKLNKYLEDVEPQIKEKEKLVKKINSADAHIHYAARNLKELFNQHSVPPRQHIKYINELINGVMNEETSEERIRKLVS